MSLDTRFMVDLEFGVKSSPSGDIELISGLENLKQRLFSRLITTRGTLCHRPDFGVGLLSYVGAISSIDSKRRLASDIKEQLEKDPQVKKVTSVLIEPDDENPSMFEVTYKAEAEGIGEFSSTVNTFKGIFA